jgi:hypothetical protein
VIHLLCETLRAKHGLLRLFGVLVQVHGRCSRSDDGQEGHRQRAADESRG